MTKELRMLVGVAFFAALALAGALGVFTFSAAQPVGAQAAPSAIRTFSSDMVAPGGTVTVTIRTADTGGFGRVTEMIPSGFTYVSSSHSGVNTSDSAAPVFTLIGAPTFTYTVMASSTASGPYTFRGTVRGADRVDRSIAPTTITVPAATNGGNGGGTDPADGDGESDTGITLSSQEPGAAIRIEIQANAGVEVPAGEDINIKLKSFDLPSTIAESHVLFSDADDGAADSYTGNPSEARISGSDTIILTVPSTLPNGNANPNGVTGSYKIVIKQSAGITNPTAGGMYTIEVDDMDADVEKPEVTINRVIKLSETSGKRGTETTATFKGFSNGTTTVFLNGIDAGDKLAEVTVSDNTGTLEIDTTPSKFMKGDNNTIKARDADGNWQNVSANFEITPTVSLDPEETAVSKSVKVSLSDWPAGSITKVELGGENYVFYDEDGEVDDYPVVAADGTISFDLNVHSTANRGTQTVKVTQGELSATASLTIGVLSLTAQPATVVPGQQITIQGSGFVANDEINSVSVGGIPVTLNPVAEASSAGDIVITINVPSPAGTAGIGSGTKTILVVADGTDESSGRVAEGEIEIPKPAITLGPVTSRRGTTVSVSGTGFPSGDLVQVKYDNNGTSVTVAAGSADASGAVSIDFVVPSYARIGTKHDVAATSVGVFAGVTAKASHETPGAMVTLSSDTISSGENITVSGMNFPAFATVAVMEIGGVDVRPVPAPATSIDGDFSTTILVPQLELGNQTVTIKVGQTTITTFLELGTATVSQVPADVFASLGDRLVRVWFLERSTQVWSFYDPDPEIADFNTLSEVSSGQIVTIILTEGETLDFNSTPSTLYAGTNPVSLK